MQSNMERNFDNKEFEKYIKRNADQYRMIPSEKVWKGISNNLHIRKRWYGLGLALLLLGTAVAVTWVMISYPVSLKQGIGSDKNVKTSETSRAIKQDQMKPSVTIGSIPSFDKFNKKEDNSIADNPYDDLAINSNPDLRSLLIVESINPLARSSEKSLRNITDETKLNSLQITGIDPEITDDNIPLDNKTSFSNPVNILAEKKSNLNYYPLTIESAVSSYQAKKPGFKKKITWQLFFTPTVSYRKLSDNKSFKNSSFFFNNQGYGYPFASSADVNSAVTHKPDLGLELGFSAGYPLSRSLKLTAGLQFNINRYDIRAYVYNREPATINLNGGSGNNSVTTWTSYRNYNGYKSDWLKNFYFSVSAQVGAHVKLFGGNKTYYGVAGTIQPTYILRDRAYLISTDYKNYAEVPDLIRHFNINTSFETFISYKTHNTRWQIGPQVRYQVLSSFQSKYPVKENLFDFGVKIGISLNQ
jgi:hypothetical protein